MRNLTAVGEDRMRRGVCTQCGRLPQENGGWCWACSDEAAAGGIPWTGTAPGHENVSVVTVPTRRDTRG